MSKQKPRRRIGVFVEWLSDGYADPIFDEITLAATERDVDILCFVGGFGPKDPDPTKSHACFTYASPSSIDGAVVVTMGNAFGADYVETYFERFKPIPLCSVAVPWTRFPSVEVENETGVRAGVRHLIRAHKRKRIACIRGPVTSLEADHRFSAYRQVLEEFGIPFDERLVTTGWYIREHGMDAVRCLIDERRVDFDAIVAANDGMALGAMEELERRNIQVPVAVSVLGFDDIDEGRHTRPSLSTVRQPIRAHGRKAFELVLDQLDGIDIPRRTFIESKLILRKSCGCVSALGGRTSSAPPPLGGVATGPKASHAWAAQFSQELVEYLSAGDGVQAKTASLTDALMRATELGDSRPVLALLERELELAHHNRVDLLLTLPLLDKQRHVMNRTIESISERSIFDDLLRDAGVLASEVAERIQAQLRYRAELLITRLLRMNEAMLLATDLSAVAQIVAGKLRQLGILACYVCEWEGLSVPAQWARLILGCEGEQALELPPDGVRFPAMDLMPKGMFDSSSASAWLICPILRSELVITSYILIRRGTAEPFVCDGLVDQIGSTLRRLALTKQVVEEVRRRETAERERIEEEMRIAAQIQTGILPQDLSVTGLDICGSMRPTTEVGGDYYDVIPVEDGCWLGVGDVAGHGLPTGLVMLMCQSVIGGLVRSQPNSQPEDLLPIANRLLFDNIRRRMKQDEHITLALIRYKSDGTIRFAGAHESMLIWRTSQQRLERVEMTGLWAGMIEDIGPMTEGCSLQLEPGDLLVLYTDGVTEARNADGKMFGDDGLADAIARFHEGSAEVVRDRILETVYAWLKTQDDDITLLVARYSGV